MFDYKFNSAIWLLMSNAHSQEYSKFTDNAFFVWLFVCLFFSFSKGHLKSWFKFDS